MPARARRPLALVSVLAITAFAGCGGAGDDAGPGDRGSRPAGVGEARIGSVAPLAMCRDWRAGSEAERQATIEDIRRQINLRDTPTRVPELSDEQARAVFDNACAEEFAAGFRLYKIYARAAGFQSLQR